MKSSTVIVILLVLQAALVMGIFAAVARENAVAVGVGESKGNSVTNGGKLKCCSKCNFSFSGLYTCDDVVKNKCDPVCKVCSAVVNKQQHPAGAAKVKLFQCTDTFLGICGPPCKKH